MNLKVNSANSDLNSNFSVTAIKHQPIHCSLTLKWYTT